MARVRPRQTQAQRSAKTRQRLLDGAIKALSEHGYSATTTILVEKLAKVSRGAMLHQFPVHADLMAFVVQSVYDEEVERYQEILRGIDDPVERLLAYPEAVWQVLSRPSGIAVLEIFQGSRSDAALARKLRPVQARIEADARARTRGELGGSTSTALMRLIVWAIRGLSIAKALTTDAAQLAQATSLLRNLIGAGLQTGTLAIRKQRRRRKDA